jgi:hypothetical protein
MALDPNDIPLGVFSLEAAEIIAAAINAAGSPPAGASGTLQFNNAGAFGGIAASTYIEATPLVQFADPNLIFAVATGPTDANDFEVSPTGIIVTASESGATLTIGSDSDITIVSANGGYNATAAGTISFGGSGVQFASTGGGNTLGGVGDKVAFYGGSPIVKPAITGAKAGNTAVTLSLLAALDALGLVTDSTT